MKVLGVRSRYYDLDGKPITITEWIGMFEDTEGRRIAWDEQGSVAVSTVWLGLDHSLSYFPDAPLIFETMIFGGRHDQYQERYSTKDQALAGHEYACNLAFGWKTKLKEILWGFVPMIPMPPRREK